MNPFFSAISSGNYSIKKWEGVNIVADGNSLVINSGVGTDGGDPFTTYLLSHLSEHLDAAKLNMTNIGVGNQTTNAMLSDFDSQIPPLVSNTPPGRLNLLIVLEVGNDIAYNGNVTAAVSRLWTYCQKARYLGFKIIVCTSPSRIYSTNLPSGDSPSVYDQKVNDANTQIRLEYADNCDQLCDLASDYRFQDPNNLTYFTADKIHHAVSGRQLIAEKIFNSMIKTKIR